MCFSKLFTELLNSCVSHTHKYSEQWRRDTEGNSDHEQERIREFVELSLAMDWNLESLDEFY